MGEEYANKCFELNKELVEQYNEKLFNKLKNVLLMRRNGVFSYKDYLNKINKKEILLLSKNVQMELGKFIKK